MVSSSASHRPSCCSPSGAAAGRAAGYRVERRRIAHRCNQMRFDLAGCTLVETSLVEWRHATPDSRRTDGFPNNTQNGLPSGRKR